MVPRGEVGLIFASIGKGLGVVDDALFSAVVVMVMVSTLITPPAIKWSLQRQAADFSVGSPCTPSCPGTGRSPISGVGPIVG